MPSLASSIDGVASKICSCVVVAAGSWSASARTKEAEDRAASRQDEAVRSRIVGI